LELIRLERAVIGYRTPLLPPLDLAVRAGSTLGVLRTAREKRRC